MRADGKLNWILAVYLVVWFVDKPAKVQEDSFAEKLVANVIKNLQIQISNIHIRYEDTFTRPGKPFAIGITLKELTFQVSSGQ